MEVGPTIHYVMGGIKVDPESAAASIPGIFAAGEVAGGLHGANRLGGNSLSDILVFGRRAGDADARALRSRSDVRVKRPHDRREPRIRAALVRPVLSNDRPAVADLHEREAGVGSADVAGEDVHGTGFGSRAAAAASRNHTP